MKIYYSRSNNVDDSAMDVHIGTFIQNLPEELRSTVELTKYRRGSTYSPQQLDEADLVLVGMPNMNDTSYIGKGCHSEIERAFKANKPVLVITQSRNSDEGGIAQTFSIGDVEILHRDFQDYARINLYNSDNNEHRIGKGSKAKDICYVFPIDNKKQVGLFANLYIQHCPSIEALCAADIYEIGHQITFTIKGTEYDCNINGDWLECIHYDNSDFFKAFGLNNDDQIKDFINDVLSPEGFYSSCYDDVNHWPYDDEEAMNIVIRAFKQLEKDINFHSGNGTDAYIPKYQFGSTITINGYNLDVHFDWLHTSELLSFYNSLGLNTREQISQWIMSLHDNGNNYHYTHAYGNNDEKMKDTFIDALYARAEMISRAPRHFVQPTETTDYSHTSSDDDLLLLL